MPCTQCENGKWRWGEGPCEYDSREECEAANEGAEMAIFAPQFQLDTPYLGDYFGLWMVHDAWFLRAVEQLQGTNLHLHLQSAEVRQRVRDRDSRSFPLSRDGIAQVNIRGPIMKAVPSAAEGTSSVRLRQQLQAARRDSEVRGIMLVMDTPGGTSKGNEDLAAEVARTAAEKPVFTFIEDLTASAGVAVASAATKRYANNDTAIYGAMGTYAVLHDLSGMAEQIGLKVYVIKAGEFKGLGEPGTEITDDQIAEVKRIVTRLNESYLQTIAKGLGRSVDSIRPLADGRVIMAADAVEQGLINGVQSYEQTYAELVEAIGVSRRTTPTVSTRSDATMAEKTPATLAELKATFPNSTAEWRESQIEAEASLSDAAINYAKFVETKAAEEREAHQKELEAAKNAAATAGQQPSSLGHTALTSANVGGDTAQQTGNPIEDFDAAVRARLPKHRAATIEERQTAIGYVARTQPELHRAYLEATNSNSKRVSRLIEEKFETPA